MKRSVAIEAIKDAGTIQLMIALDPSCAGLEYSEMATKFEGHLREEGKSIFDSSLVMAEVAVDALEKAGLVFES